MTDVLDRLLHDAAPISDDEVRALPLDDVERELCAAIVARSRESVAAPGEVTERSRRSRRWSLPALGAVAAAGAVALAIALAGGGEELGTSPERAWAAPALRVANAVPRLLVGEPGWEVVRADEFSVGNGEMTFRNGPRGVDLHWSTDPSFEEWVDDRSHDTDRLPPVDVLGASAKVFAYRGPYDDYTALWRSGRYTLELRTSYPRRLSLEDYRRVLGSLRTVGVDDWLEAMPASAVLPADTGDAVAEMLDGIPLPPGLDASSVVSDETVRDDYQLGARVTAAVACGWIESWVSALRSGDAAASVAAVEAMRGSHDWPVLREMQAEGAYPDVLWGFADRMKPDAPVPADGPPLSVEHYREALGC